MATCGSKTLGQPSGPAWGTLQPNRPLPRNRYKGVSYTPPGPFGTGNRPDNEPNALPIPFANHQQVQELSFNTTDVLVDPNVQAYWATWEGQHQQPSYDASVHYGQSIAVALEAQERDFYIGEDPFHPTYTYLHNLQQIPGSMWKVEDASFNPWRTPQIVNRFAYLPRAAAQWAIRQMNKKMRANHPCFSLAQREHFEQQYPPQSCGDPLNKKVDPIQLIRVFHSRIKYTPEGQEIYLTLEIGNLITAGAGGMFAVTVYTDRKGNFVHYELDRDRKQEFVLPRSRELYELVESPWSGASSIHGT